MAGWDDWKPVRRVGRPEFKATGTRVKVRVWTKGRLHDNWREYFMSKVSEQRLNAVYHGAFWEDRHAISGSCGEDDAERYIEMLDSAIDYANTRFETDILPNLVRGNRGNGSPTTRLSSAKLASMIWQRSWRSRSKDTAHPCNHTDPPENG
jgi:hypothetical protein